MKLSLITSYTMSSDTVFEMPAGKTWADVTDWYVKWGTLHLTFADDTTAEIETTSATIEDADFKRPDRAEIRPVDADGGTDWSVDELDSCG